MVIPVGKLAPPAAALVFVAYCVWPSLSELASGPRPTPPKKVPELAAALFSPAMLPSPTRNPFEYTDAALLAAAKKSPKAAGRTAVQAAALGTAKTADKPVDPLGGLRLDATSILGDQRLAVINGQLYALHDSLAGNSATPPYRIVGVFSYKVLLEREGKTVELAYSDAASRSASAPHAGVRGKLAAAGASLVKKPQAASTVAKSGGNNLSNKAGK
jgi:hypothetical protein